MARWARSVFSVFAFWALASGPGQAVMFPYKTIPVGSSASVVAIGDLNGDGRLDVAVATGGGGDPTSERSVFVFHQTALGRLATPVRYRTGIEARGIAIGDLNGDRAADLAVCGGASVMVLRQSGGSLGTPNWFATGAGADSVAIGDLNGDGRGDLAVSHSDEPHVAVLYQTVQGGLASPLRYPVLEAGANEIAIGDLTGDGLADLLFMRGRAGLTTLTQLVQDPATHRLRMSSRYGWGEERASHGFALADINGDQRLDVAMTWGDERPQCGFGVLYQRPEGGLSQGVPFGSMDGPGPIKAADMNRDGRLDLVIAHGGWQTVGTLIQQPDGRFLGERLDPIPFNSHYEAQGLALGDLNGDGWTDIALADANRGLVLIYHAGNRDITPPETVLVAKPPVVTRFAPVFSFRGTDDVTPPAGLQYRWNLDGGAWSPFTGSTSVTLTGLAEGWHEFSVAARDAAGNVDYTPPSFKFGIDRTPPSGLTLTGVGAHTSASSVTISTEVSDNLADVEELTFSWRVNGGPWSEFSYAWRITLSGLFEGAYTLEARAADPAGNISAPAAIRFTVDRTPP